MQDIVTKEYTIFKKKIKAVMNHVEFSKGSQKAHGPLIVDLCSKW